MKSANKRAESQRFLPCCRAVSNERKYYLICGHRREVMYQKARRFSQRTHSDRSSSRGDCAVKKTLLENRKIVSVSGPCVRCRARIRRSRTLRSRSIPGGWRRSGYCQTPGATASGTNHLLRGRSRLAPAAAGVHAVGTACVKHRWASACASPDGRARRASASSSRRAA